MKILNQTYNRVFMEEANPDGGAGGGGNEAPKGEEWKSDPTLDENGNLKVETPAKEEPKKEPETPKEPKEEFNFNTPIVEQVSKLLSDAGLNPQDVAKAVTANDGKITPDLIKSLSEKHGDAVASIVASQLEGFHKESTKVAATRDAEVYNQVEKAFEGITDQSGQDTWKELSTWAKENVPNDVRKDINKLLQQGGLAATYAINDLVSRFKSSDSFTQEAQLLEGSSLSNDNGVTPLSRSEYNAELRKLEQAGHVYGQSNEMAKLDKRRQLGMNRGI